MKKTIYSGIQPSGDLHIGNYLGAVRQWIRLQNQKSKIKGQNQNLKFKTGKNVLDEIINDQLPITDGVELFFNIADLHTITVPQNPIVLREKILELSALFIACGIDPNKSHLFIQSENPDHCYLTWIFDCFINFGQLSRMTQFKDKSSKLGSSFSVGLFNYPALMASDILLYNTDFVPVGHDQSQHLELTCDIANKFNNRFCHSRSNRESISLDPRFPNSSFGLRGTGHKDDKGASGGDKVIFTIPKPLLDKESARIMSLSNPSSKMSKSDNDPNGTINLLDKPDDIAKKISRAVTDSGSEIIFDPEAKPAIANLLIIYSKFSGSDIFAIVSDFKGKGYSDFKKGLSEVLINHLAPIQKRYTEIRADKDYLNKVLDQGLNFAKNISSKKILQVKQAVGVGR